ncbi:hypothetical protein [Methylobacterium sp. J-090]|uniref:hypothetical protein n=1 Tax=Methylobacterium sp. J-090 TaxID=2836666 RepID=UPI001FBA6003|nr:hypothetical protein [Methylobacterium sp. J-090]MCJ2080958.1 hypothetical protein [Methylobacterium sp. J-090]
MLAKLLGAIAGGMGEKVLAEQQPADLPPEALQFESMVPLRPPPAQNDDGMQRVREAVEKALREAGHLQ